MTWQRKDIVHVFFFTSFFYLKICCKNQRKYAQSFSSQNNMVMLCENLFPLWLIGKLRLWYCHYFSCDIKKGPVLHYIVMTEDGKHLDEWRNSIFLCCNWHIYDFCVSKRWCVSQYSVLDVTNLFIFCCGRWGLFAIACFFPVF